MSEIQAGIFDIDNTLIGRGDHLLHTGLEDVLAPDIRTFDVSQVTARGLQRYQEVLHINPAMVPSPGMPLGLEYGTQLVVSSNYMDRKHFKSVGHTPLSPAEQQHIVEYLDANRCTYAAFYPQDPAKRRIIFVPSYTDAAQLSSSHVYDADIYNDTINVFAHMIRDANPGMVVVRQSEADEAKPPVFALDVHTTRFGGKVTFDMVPKGTDKKNAVLKIEEMCGYDREKLLVVGDDAPDIGMLTLRGVTAAIVRNKKVDERMFPANIPRLEPEELAPFIVQKTSSY